MDIYCPTCGEPWEIDCLWDEVDTSGRSYDEVSAEFRARGCGALATTYPRKGPCGPASRSARDTLAAIYEICGDDMDGAAVDAEDAIHLGFL